MVNFHSYVSLPEGTIHFLARLSICTFLHGKISRKLTLTASPRCPERCTVAAKTFPSKSKLMKSSQVETSIYSGCSYIFHDFPIVFLKNIPFIVDVVIFPWIYQGFPIQSSVFHGESLEFPSKPPCVPTFSKVPQHWWWHWSRPRGGRARPWPGETRSRIAEGDASHAKRGKSWESDRNIFYKWSFFLNWKIIVNGGWIPFFNVAHQIPVRLGNLRFESWIERVPDDIEGFRGLVRWNIAPGALPNSAHQRDDGVGGLVS